MKTRREILSGAAAIAAVQMAGLSAAQAQPLDGTVRIVLPFPAGTGSDLIARTCAGQLQGQYAKTVIVENRPGAGGLIALESMKRATPDGRTLLLIPSPLLALYPHVYPKLSYDPVHDFKPVATVYSTAVVMLVGSTVPESVTNLAQFIAWAKAQPQSVLFSANARGVAGHFLGLRFGKEAGVKLDFVPYAAAAQAAQALMAGDIQMAALTLGTAVSLVKSGKLRAIAVFTPERLAVLPDLPTFKERGYPDLYDEEWGGIFVPTGVPADLITRMESILHKGISEPSVVEFFQKLNVRPVYRNSEETAQRLKVDTTRYGVMVQGSGVTLGN